MGACPRPSYILVGDAVHSETRLPQEPELRKHGVPLIGRHEFCDIKIPKQPHYQLDSGQSAILAACQLGGCPVYPVGIDCWLGEATYFHDPNADVVCKRQNGRRVPQQLEILAAALDEYPEYDVRPQSGLLKLLLSR